MTIARLICPECTTSLDLPAEGYILPDHIDLAYNIECKGSGQRGRTVDRDGNPVASDSSSYIGETEKNLSVVRTVRVTRPWWKRLLRLR